MSCDPELLSAYLLVLNALSLLSLLATFLHSIPFPNNITVYNFVTAGMTFALYYWLNGRNLCWFWRLS